jgi:butyrate kinase
VKEAARFSGISLYKRKSPSAAGKRHTVQRRTDKPHNRTR